MKIQPAQIQALHGEKTQTADSHKDFMMNVETYRRPFHSSARSTNPCTTPNSLRHVALDLLSLVSFMNEAAASLTNKPAALKTFLMSAPHFKHATHRLYLLLVPGGFSYFAKR